jgi:hypothetical protein
MKLRTFLVLLLGAGSALGLTAFWVLHLVLYSTLSGRETNLILRSFPVDAGLTVLVVQGVASAFTLLLSVPSIPSKILNAQVLRPKWKPPVLPENAT